MSLTDAVLGVTGINQVTPVAGRDGRNAAGVLPPGASVTFYKTATIVGDKTNMVDVTGQPTNSAGTLLPGVPVTQTDTARVDELPTLTVDKTNDADADGTYTDSEIAASKVGARSFRVIITNTSTDAVAITSLVDTPHGAQCAALVGTSIAGGASVTCDFTATVDLTSVASEIDTFATTVTDATGNVGIGNDTSVVLLSVADLEIIKRAAPGPYVAPAIVTFELTITNKGPSIADDVLVTDTLPGGMTYIAAGSDPRCASSDGTIITCGLGTLATGASVSLTIVASVASVSSVSTFTNVATVSSSTPDSTLANNTASATVNVVASEATPPELPKTGAPVDNLLKSAATLAIIGGFLYFSSRRRRRHDATL